MSAPASEPMDQASGRAAPPRVGKAMGEALADCARVLLTEGGRDEIEASLEALGRAAEVDIVGIGRNVEDPAHGLCVEVEHWIDVDGGDGAPSHWELVPWDRLPSFRDRLARGEINRFSSLDELEDLDRSLFEETPAHIRAEIEIPIVRDGTWIGHMLLAERRPGRHWSDDEVRLLRALGDMFSSNWGRQEALRQRDRSLAVAGALLECSELLLRSDVERPVEKAVEAIRAAIGCSAAFVDEHVEEPDHGASLKTIHAVADGGQAAAALTSTPWSRWPGAFEALAGHRPYSFSSRDEVTGTDRAYLESRAVAVEAEIDYPVVIDGKLAGVVGVADTRARHWTEDEHRMVAATARMIGAYWQRERVHRRLEDLLKAKDQFVASVSHELRTPLAVVVGLAAELRDSFSAFDTDDVREMISLLARESGEVAAIVEDLLVAARIEDARLTVVQQRMDLTATVREVLDALPVPDGVVFRAELQPATVVVADPMRVRQVVRNLILNAHRHGGPDVLVEVRERPGHAVVAVSDDGPGIEPDAAEAVFEAYRSIGSTPGMTASIGLGLTVSRSLARLMGGDLVHSRPAGRTVFEFTLPSVPEEDRG